VFLDLYSRCFRGFIGRIRAFRLPIHLEAKSAAVRLLALCDRPGKDSSGTDAVVMVLRFTLPSAIARRDGESVDGI
jgi:hypothetical protein